MQNAKSYSLFYHQFIIRIFLKHSHITSEIKYSKLAILSGEAQWSLPSVRLKKRPLFTNHKVIYRGKYCEAQARVRQGEARDGS